MDTIQSKISRLSFTDQRFIKTRSSNRQQAILWIILSLFWPFMAAVLQLKSYKRVGLTGAFVIFCAYAGWVYHPSPGSDADTYAQTLNTYGSLAYKQMGEFFYVTLFWLMGNMGLGSQTYFALVGLTYALTITWIFKSISNEFDKKYISTLSTSFIFLAFFFLNQPVFAAINARYHLGIWIMLASTLAVLNKRYSLSAVFAVMGASIHFGHSIWVVALTILLLSRALGRWQIVFAYILLTVAYFLPPNFALESAARINPIELTAFTDKLQFYASLAERNAILTAQGASYIERAWFLNIYKYPIFISLLISGHILAYKVKDKRKSRLNQLWVLIIIMLALQVSFTAEYQTSERVERNVVALLLMWHALWFLSQREGARLALVINMLPAIFYFVVAYRRWFNDANVAAFLPSPFGFYSNILPSIMEALGFT